MVLIFSVLIGIVLGFAGGKPAVQHYTSKYDHIDIETIINNRRMVNHYAACLLSQGPCPPEGTELKRTLPEALETNCARCTEKLAAMALHVIRRLKKEYPKIWFQLCEKWDPNDIYIKKFESTFGSRNIPAKPSDVNPLSIDLFEGSDDANTANKVDGSFTLATTTSRQDPTTHKVISTTNPQSSTISIPNQTDYPYPPTSLVSKAYKPSTISLPKTTTSRTTTRPSTTTKSVSSTTKYKTISSSRQPITSGPSTTTSSVSSTPYKISTSTRQPIIPGFIPINTFFTTPERPLTNFNIGANIEATVSGIVRGLGAVGTRVVETGADIADVVIKNFARPLNI